MATRVTLLRLKSPPPRCYQITDADGMPALLACTTAAERDRLKAELKEVKNTLGILEGSSKERATLKKRMTELLNHPSSQALQHPS